jgi:hypothetical protein
MILPSQFSYYGMTSAKLNHHMNLGKSFSRKSSGRSAKFYSAARKPFPPIAPEKPINQGGRELKN